MSDNLESTIASYLKANLSKLKKNNVDDFARDMAMQVRNTRTSRNTVDAATFAEESRKAVEMFLKGIKTSLTERLNLLPSRSLLLLLDRPLIKRTIHPFRVLDRYR